MSNKFEFQKRMNDLLDSWAMAIKKEKASGLKSCLYEAADNFGWDSLQMSEILTRAGATPKQIQELIDTAETCETERQRFNEAEVDFSFLCHSIGSTFLPQ